MDDISSSKESARTERSEWRQIILLLVIWAVTAGAITLPRITSAAFGVQGDLPLHYHITRSFARSIDEGDPFPRWAGLLDGGRGDAIFTFYPPLSYLLSWLSIKLFGLDVLGSLKLVSILVVFLAEVSAFLLAREFFDRKRSVVVSVIYVVMPAFSLITLHRAFFANGLGLALMPLALLGAVRMLAGQAIKRSLPLFALGMSAIILTHAISAYLTGVTIALLCLVRLPAGEWRGYWRLLIGGAAVLGLTLFFLWPQAVERDWIQIGLQLVQQDYRNYFLFAGSPDGSRYRQAWADLNFVTSLMTISQTLTALFLAWFCRQLIFSNRAESDPGEVERRRMLFFCLAVVFFGFFISIGFSGLFWKYLPGMKFVQFPWRYQPVVSLATGLIAVSALDGWKNTQRRSRTVPAALLTWLVIANLITTVMLVKLDGGGITRSEVREILEGKNMQPLSLAEATRLQDEDDLKYLPYSANQLYFRPVGADRTIYPPAESPGGVSIVKGICRVISQQPGIAHREFSLECDEPSQVRIETYQYPHWVVRVDGNETPKSTEKSSGMILFNLDAGRHRVTLDFEVRIFSEKAAGAVSLMAGSIFVIWLIFMKREKR